MGNAVELTNETFETQVLQGDRPALVDFWAPWCGPCRMMAPIIEALAARYADRALVAKVNVDENPLLATKYGIRSIPSLLLFKGGNKVDQVVGVHSEEDLARMLDKALAG